MSDLLQFHNLSHTFISLIGALLLAAIYFNIRRRYSDILEEGDTIKRIDKGLLYLSLSLLTWTISGIWAFTARYYAFHDLFIYQIGVNLLSIVNNMFLLLGLYFFSFAPNFISNNEKNVRLVIYTIAVVTLMTLVVSYFIQNSISHGIKWMALPDLILSGFICYLLLIALYKTFMHRGLKIVAVLSVIIMILVFISQLSEVFLVMDDVFLNSLIKIIAKNSLIGLFLVLATTWVIQLAHTPQVQEIQIKFLDWSLVELSIPSKGIVNERIDFGSKTTQYKNLLKLGIRRKFGSPKDQSLQVGNAGEIKSQTYLTRIIDNMNDLLELELEDRLERKDLLTFIGEGKYRLRMLPEHISIDPALQSEFIKLPEHQAYAELCNSV